MTIKLKEIFGPRGIKRTDLTFKDVSLLKDPNATGGNLEKGVDAILSQESNSPIPLPTLDLNAEDETEKRKGFRTKARVKTDAFYCPVGMTQVEFVRLCSEERMTQEILNKIAGEKRRSD